MRPPWIFPDYDSDRIVIAIKASMGFGTGQHPSTRLALSLLQRVPCDGRDVLDVGTGSGVLAMAAARLGGRRIVAIDRDPNAIDAAREGLRRNALSQRIELAVADVSAAPKEEFDVVVANLEAEQIQQWAPALLDRVRPEGVLLLSGFLLAELESVRSAVDLAVTHTEVEDGWAGIVVSGRNRGGGNAVGVLAEPTPHMDSLNPSECDCPCHRGGQVVHFVPCCKFRRGSA